MDAALSALLRRDRAVALGGLLAVAALAWGWLARMAGTMAPDAMAMPHRTAWGAAELLVLFPMWAVMMAAMMLPSAAPVVLLVAAANRTRRRDGRPAVPTALFVLGYLAVWTAFAAAAAAAQVALHEAALLSPAMVSASRWLAGGLLMAAGLYQWSPLKNRCLGHCRSPLAFVSAHWREGSGGALRMGIEHGAYCLGCCWALMALLFVAGVMNLLWVAALAAFVLVEKAAPGGRVVGRLAGMGLVGWGVWVLAHA